MTTGAELNKIYDDYVWFTNPGGLPEGITIEQLKTPQRRQKNNKEAPKQKPHGRRTKSAKEDIMKANEPKRGESDKNANSN